MTISFFINKGEELLWTLKQKLFLEKFKEAVKTNSPQHIQGYIEVC